MGRGSDLLFNPPRIKKATLKPVGVTAEFTSEVKEMFFLDQETLLARDIHGTVRIYKERDGQLKMRSGRNVVDGALLAGSGDMFAVSVDPGDDEEEFVVTKMDDREDINIDIPPLPKNHEPYDLILTNSYLYAPALNIQTGNSHLFRIAPDADEWTEMSGYTSHDEMRITKSGGSTILLFNEGSASQGSMASKGSAEMITTFTPNGLGASFAINNTGFTREDLDLVSPGREDGTYLAIKETAERESALSFFDMRSGASESFFHLGDKKAFDLAREGEHIFLLTEDELLLFRERDKSLVERFSLQEPFTRLSAHPSFVLLWNQGRSDYQRIDLKRP